MEGVFPADTGISRVRAIINILKQNKGRLGITELAEESEEDVDDLLPQIEACKLLGLLVIDDADLKLTEKGERLTFSNFSKFIRESLVALEPFRSVLKILGNKEVPSQQLFSGIHRRGIAIHGDKATNEILLKKLLLRWGVRSKLMSYNSELDLWKKNLG